MGETNVTRNWVIRSTPFADSQARARTHAVAMETTIRLLLVGADPRVRRGVSMRLASESDMAVVGEACDSPTAMSACAALGPCVVVLDLGVRDANGCISLNQLRELAQSNRVVVLSLDNDPRLRQLTEQAGAAALVDKLGDPDHLLAAIRTVAAEINWKQRM